MMYEYSARLVRCVDADTLVMDLDLGFSQWRVGQSYRLLRIDAPEMSTQEGKAARTAVVLFLSGKALAVQTHKADSFGRFLVEVCANGENVSDWLVRNGHAVYRNYK